MTSEKWHAVNPDAFDSKEEYRKTGGIFIKEKGDHYKVIEGVYVPHANPEMAERSGQDYLFLHYTLYKDEMKGYEYSDSWTEVDAIVEEMGNHAHPHTEDQTDNYWGYLEKQGINESVMNRPAEEAIDPKPEIFIQDRVETDAMPENSPDADRYVLSIVYPNGDVENVDYSDDESELKPAKKDLEKEHGLR